MKKVFIFFIMIIFLTGNLSLPQNTYAATNQNVETVANNYVIQFWGNRKLQELINLRLWRPANTNITKADAASITWTFTITQKWVDDLEWIQFLVNVNILDARSNNISDATPLTKFPATAKLIEVRLNLNKITSLDFIPQINLPLKKLNLSHNLLTGSIPNPSTALASSLEEFYIDTNLWWNKIENISNIVNYTQLKRFWFWENKVADISPLKNTRIIPDDYTFWWQRLSLTVNSDNFLSPLKNLDWATPQIIETATVKNDWNKIKLLKKAGTGTETINYSYPQTLNWVTKNATGTILVNYTIPLAYEFTYSSQSPALTKESVKVTLKINAEINPPAWWTKKADWVYEKTFAQNATENFQFSFVDATIPATPNATITVNNIDKTSPTIDFLQDVPTNYKKQHTVKIKVSDDNPDTNSYYYGFSDSNTCDASVTYSNSFVSESEITLNDSSKNWKYLCVTAKDSVWNISYKSSTNPIKIDNVAPTVSWVSEKIFVVWSSEAQNYTLTSGLTFSDNVDNATTLASLFQCNGFSGYNPNAVWIYTVTCSLKDSSENEVTGITWNVKIVQADKTALRDAVNIATTAKNHPKVYEWKAEVERVITQANTVLNDTNATTSDITQAISNLNQAISRLRRDETAPEIYWVSEKEIFVWDDFSPLAWVTATDNIDWKITLTVNHITENTVKIDKTWEYKIKYEVSDSKWNKTIIERKIIVKENDKAELKKEIEKAEEKLKNSQLSLEDAKKLQEEIKKAKDILNNVNAKKDEIEKVTKSLNKFLWWINYWSSPNRNGMKVANDSRVKTWNEVEENNTSKQENTQKTKEEKVETKQGKETKQENEKVQENNNENNKEPLLLEELKKKLEEQWKELKVKEINWTTKIYSTSKKYSNCEMIPNIIWDYNKDYKINFKDQENIKNQDEVQRLTKVKILNEKWVNNTELFEGTRWITRAEFLAIVLQVHCYDVSKQPDSLLFYDVDLKSWQARVVKVWSEIWLIQWYERDSRGIPFRPDVEISKIEAFWIMMKMKEIEKMESYKDRYIDKKADWQEKPLSTGEYLWILKPEQTDFRFNPDSHLTRDEMVKLIVDIVRLY